MTFLSSDIYPDGGKIILVSGAPMSTGDDAARVLTAARQCSTRQRSHYACAQA